MLFLLLMVFLVCHPRRGSASALAVACSLCHPTQILSFRPKQFAHFANCEAQKPASLPKPLTSQDIRCCRCLLPQGMPSPNPQKPVKPLRQVTTIESTISMCIAIPSISLYIDRREQKAPERSGAFCTRSNRNHLNGILCEMDIPKISTLRRGKTEVRT
jgi:hypothetical protein